jgi:hypothetical protein
VEAALAAWRAAERTLEEAPEGAPHRSALETECRRLRERYQRITLAARGRIDQLEGAAEASWDRLSISADRAETSRRWADQSDSGS